MKQWQASFQAKLDNRKLNKLKQVERETNDDEDMDNYRIRMESQKVDISPLEEALKDVEDNSKTVDRSKLPQVFQTSSSNSNRDFSSVNDNLVETSITISVEQLQNSSSSRRLSGPTDRGSQALNDNDTGNDLKPGDGEKEEEEADYGGYDTT
jgi:hypothetical protein